MANVVVTTWQQRDTTRKQPPAGLLQHAHCAPPLCSRDYPTKLTPAHNYPRVFNVIFVVTVKNRLAHNTKIIALQSVVYDYEPIYLVSFRDSTMAVLWQLLIIGIAVTSCHGGLIEDIVEWLNDAMESKPQAEGRSSMSEALVKYLDLILPKDDWSSRILKHLFILYTTDGIVAFSSELIGLEANW
ncbi:hypothetical protein MSG28_008764 [Choristoneura fumiferana]|uniref:Uncharacterized protein n=1 Tax=Choristoneura fumiferana TaxID=7141 RepID=A0ACC0J7X2_CHOFU|nr:hypothetical protein MSG28_008764 [Choristoneura fumiferana]